MLFKFLHELLHPLLSLCQGMSKIPSPQTAVALDEETNGIGGGDLGYDLRAGTRREQ
jgi:hypothetical protein